MRSFGRPDVIRQKIKTALALLLFRENAVSLSKAADVAEMSYARFLDVLHSQGIAAYECNDQECAWNDEAVNAYRQTAVKQ